MKRLLLFLVCVMLQVTLLAQDSKPATDANAVADSQPTANSKPAANSDRMFFPKDWYWGWAQFDITPPHNEADPNLCAANAGQFGGVHSQCSAFGRYMISGAVELRPFGSISFTIPRSCSAKTFRKPCTPGRGAELVWSTPGALESISLSDLNFA